MNVSQLRLMMLAPLRQNSHLALIVGTTVLSVFTFWYYGRCNRLELRRTCSICHDISQRAFNECKQLLKDGEREWNVDIRNRDTEVRRLELQNVEQTRSVARLEAAMKMCLQQDK